MVHLHFRHRLSSRVGLLPPTKGQRLSSRPQSQSKSDAFGLSTPTADAITKFDALLKTRETALMKARSSFERAVAWRRKKKQQEEAEAAKAAEADRKKRRLDSLLEVVEEGRLASADSAGQQVLTCGAAEADFA